MKGDIPWTKRVNEPHDFLEGFFLVILKTAVCGIHLISE